MENYDNWKKALALYKDYSHKREHEGELSNMFRGSKITARFIFRSNSNQSKFNYDKDCKDFGEIKIINLVNRILSL